MDFPRDEKAGKNYAVMESGIQTPQNGEKRRNNKSGCFIRGNHLGSPSSSHLRGKRKTLQVHPRQSESEGESKQTHGDTILTSTTTFKAVSLPKLSSVLGTLLLMEAGRTQMGMQSSWWLPRASANMTELSKA